MVLWLYEMLIVLIVKLMLLRMTYYFRKFALNHLVIIFLLLIFWSSYSKYLPKMYNICASECGFSRLLSVGIFTFKIRVNKRFLD
jgi:hypothetical protein